MSDLVIDAGTDREWQVSLFDSDEDAVTAFTSSATLVGKVWPGDDQAATFTPTCTWIDATAGTLKLSIGASQTTSVTPGVYHALITVAEGGKTYTGWRGTIQIRGVLGSATAPTAYCTLQDMQALCGWIEKLQNECSDQSGFAEQRHAAREWMDDLAQRHYRNDDNYDTTRFLSYPYVFGRTGARSDALQGYLDADGLSLTGPVKRCCAAYSLAEVFRGQMGREDNNGYDKHARRFARMANDLAACLTLEIDTDDDGEPDLAINLGTADRIDG